MHLFDLTFFTVLYRRRVVYTSALGPTRHVGYVRSVTNDSMIAALLLLNGFGDAERHLRLMQRRRVSKFAATPVNDC